LFGKWKLLWAYTLVASRGQGGPDQLDVAHLGHAPHPAPGDVHVLVELVGHLVGGHGPVPIDQQIDGVQHGGVLSPTGLDLSSHSLSKPRFSIRDLRVTVIRFRSNIEVW